MFRGIWRWFGWDAGLGSGGLVCAAASIAARVSATANITGRVDATASIVPRVSATASIEEC